LFASSSAILFSNPSPLSLEKGRLPGSAQTRRADRSTASTRSTALVAVGANAAAALTSMTAKAKRGRGITVLAAHAGVRGIGRGLRLARMLGGPAAADHAVGPGLQIGIDVINIAHDVRIGAERRHLQILRGVHVLLAIGDDADELVMGHGLQRVHQARPEGASDAVETVAGLADGVETTIAV